MVFSTLFNTSKPNKKPNSGVDVVPSRAMVKEVLDMQSLREDIPSKFVNKTSQTSTRVNTPLGVDPKALAKAAAARIDAIEKEMALDLRGSDVSKIAVHPRAAEVASRGGGFVKVALPPGMVQTAPALVDRSPALAAVDRALTIMPEYATQMYLGNTTLAQVIHVQESTVAPALEEAAVLYANGQLDDAIQTLKAAFSAPGTLGASEFNAYRTLLDMLRIQGDQAMFENVAMDFVIRFEKSPPSWEVNVEDDAPVVLFAVPGIDLGSMLDVSIVPMLEQLKVLAQHSNTLRMDASHITAVNVVDGFGCELMLRVMKAFEQADYALEVVGIPQLVAALKPHIKAGNASTSPHVWMLYFELLRLVNQQGIFEERAEEYVLTYEQSPPAWVPPSNNIKMSHSDEGLPTTIMEFNRPDHIRLKGDVVGEGDALINEIAHGLQDHLSVICDCTKLNRVEFTAAAKLLTALTYWTSENKVVEFRNLNHPIAALFVTLGLQHLAVVERRRDA